MTRAAIYARYSSDLQSAASIEDQARLCKERIKREGWTLAATYSDRAQSGASALRAGYQAMLEDARKGNFDIVVAEALDRLTRDQQDVAGLYKHLTFAGVKLITLTEGEISELHVGLKGTMNALFLKDLAAKTRRGLRGRIEAGRSGGGLCYGYDVVREHDARGEPIHGGRTINAEEAEVVQRIFRDFAAGKSPRRIAFALNDEGVPAPGGAGWGASTINGNAARGTGILNNELYIGRLVWNRLRYIKDPSTGKRISRLNPESDWVVQDAPALRIVEQDVWGAVKAHQKSATKDTRPDYREERPFWARTRPKYMFSGLMRCGTCGGAYSKISANLFGCATARNKGTCGNRLNIRRDVLEATVLDGLKHRLMDPALYKVFIDEFIRGTNRLRSTESSSADRAKADLAAIDRRLRKIVDAIADGVPARTLKDELMALEGKRPV
jgi:DNA invertase Pin-like site-specific DNA recombinase